MTYINDKAFEVAGFRHKWQDWVVFGLASSFQQPDISVGIPRGIRHDLEELSFAHVVGARAANQNPAWPEHLEGAQVELFVSAQGGIKIFPGFGKRRRIQNDRIVLATRG